MPLVECVKGAASSSDVIQAVLQATRKLGKVGVLVGNCDGFVGNRMLKGYQDEVCWHKQFHLPSLLIVAVAPSPVLMLVNVVHRFPLHLESLAVILCVP